MNRIVLLITGLLALGGCATPPVGGLDFATLGAEIRIERSTDVAAEEALVAHSGTQD